jgi:hypothetical protein
VVKKGAPARAVGIRAIASTPLSKLREKILL